MSNLTLLDMAIRNGSDGLAGLIEENINATPEVSGINPLTGKRLGNVGMTRTIRGRQYKTRVRTALPTVTFRNANEGQAGVKSTYENRLVETFILDPKITADKAVADSAEDGWEAAIAEEADGIIAAAMLTLGQQFYYGKGTGGDLKGHPGLIQSYDSANMEVDAGGTTADTGSSVWFVKWGLKDVVWVYGQEGQLELSDVRIGDIDDANGNQFTAYIQQLTAYPGVQMKNKNASVRIKKLTADAGKGMTDALGFSALSKFPSGVIPDVCFMTKRSLEQLRASRTATNATGAPAPTPTDIAGGIPILDTSSLLNTEALTL